MIIVSFDVSSQVSNTDYNILLNKACSSYEKSDYEEALNYYLTVKEKCTGNDSVLRLYVRSEIGASLCYAKMSKYEDAYNTAVRLLDLKLTEDERSEAINIMFDNGLFYIDKIRNDYVNKFDVICGVYENLLAYAEGDRKKEIADDLQDVYLDEGLYLVLNFDFTSAMDILKKGYTISDDLQHRLDILDAISMINENQHDIELSINCYKEIRRLASILKDDLHHYKAIISERQIYKNLNDMEKYASLGVSLDSLISNSDDITILSEYYEMAGNELVKVGNYKLAEKYFNRFLDLIEKSPENKSLMEFNYFSNMRDLRYKQNDFRSALDYNEKLSKDSGRKVADNIIFNFSLNIVNSYIYAQLNDSINFKRNSESLLKFREYISDAFNKALVYNVIGKGYSIMGKSNEALENFIKSDSILSKEYKETFNMSLIVKEERVVELVKMGRADEACDLCRHLLELVAQSQGKQSQFYSRLLYRYANSLRVAGKKEEVGRLFSQSIDIIKNILRKQLRYVPATERRSYIKTLSAYVWNMVNNVLQFSNTDKEYVKQCYNTTMMLKSLLFETDRSMYNTLQLKGTKEDVDDFVKLSTFRMKRKYLLKDYTKNKNKIDSIEIKIRELDNKLTEKSHLYSDYTSFIDFNYEDVRKYLDDDDVMFDLFDYINNRGEHIYIAYVIKKGLDTPAVVKLFKENEIDSLLNGSTMDMLYDASLSEKALKVLWDPISKYAKKGSKVYFVPSGIMYQISLSSIPLKDGSLLGEHYDFVRLTSAHRIADRQTGLTENMRAVLYGGLKYDISIEDIKKESKKYKHKNLYTLRSSINNKFSYLPKTEYEVREIADILKKEDYDVTLYTGEKGTEESFLSMHNNSPQILHIASHGFYYTPEEATRSYLLKGLTDAMFLSGLVLSGANAAWMGQDQPDNVSGGIISAANISNLDFSNTNLVVLSACRSGQGKITREGLFGMQRAFKKAGVKTMVMSLWDVSDVVTSEFMIEFYKNLFKDKYKNDMKKAFMKAKQEIRKKYPEPIYWAGFVMVD